MMRLLSVFNTICKQARRSYSCKMTRFADSDTLCLPLNLNPEDCGQRHQDERQKLVNKCCILRSERMKPCRSVPLPKKKIKEPDPPFRSMWEPPCRTATQPHCPRMLPRFDSIYYHPSHKCRCYQRTWQECPPVHQRLRKLCCLDRIRPPEVLYRIKEHCPKTACERDYKRLRRLCDSVHIDDDEKKKCCKINWPCCPAARCNPICKLPFKGLSGCKKLRAPLPSFSETHRKWACRKRPTECKCLRTITQCELIRAGQPR